MSDTVSDLASGSQDLAALLGLFCTDGVERNALAYNFGWGTVVASSLSLLGVLGLIKSSIKLALGLRYCQQAGFNLDSLRGIFGYLPGESPTTGSLVECSVIQVELSPSRMSINTTRRYVYSIPCNDSTRHDWGARKVQLPKKMGESRFLCAFTNLSAKSVRSNKIVVPSTCFEDLYHNPKAPDTGDANFSLWIRYFSGTVTPVVNYAGSSWNIWDHQIAINPGNLRDESAWRQNPIVIVTALVV